MKSKSEERYHWRSFAFKHQFAPLMAELARRSKATRAVEAALTTYILHHPLEFEVVTGMSVEVARQLLAQGAADAERKAAME